MTVVLRALEHVLGHVDHTLRGVPDILRPTLEHLNALLANPSSLGLLILVRVLFLCGRCAVCRMLALVFRNLALRKLCPMT